MKLLSDTEAQKATRAKMAADRAMAIRNVVDATDLAYGAALITFGGVSFFDQGLDDRRRALREFVREELERFNGDDS